jgi:CHASE2 domain-containing sensor protein
MELIPGFVSLPEEFREVFNVQSFPIFVELMTGWALLICTVAWAARSTDRLMLFACVCPTGRL